MSEGRVGEPEGWLNYSTKPVLLGNESQKILALGDVHVNPWLGSGHQTCKSYWYAW